MKMAIQGHPTRGGEVIQILKSLGGSNPYNYSGDNPACYYEIHGNTILCACTKSNNYKYYTLEEFEKEFPFKIGIIATIPVEMLEPYKEMKEERNITLTLDKAKEWYKKGGELKEIALQTFTERELNPLPRSWEEFCKQGNPVASWRYNIPIKYETLFKLEQLRDCWRQGNIPQELKCKIRKVKNKYTIVYGAEDSFLSFCDRQTAEEFLECFKDLIEKAGDLI